MPCSVPHHALSPITPADCITHSDAAACAQVMRLEKELGTSHPEVGKAYLSLSRLYLGGCEESSSKQLAVAALSRSWEILNVCQVGCCCAWQQASLLWAARWLGAWLVCNRRLHRWCHRLPRADLLPPSLSTRLLQLALKKQPSCTSSFTHLMQKMRTAAAAGAPAAMAAQPPPPAAAAALVSPTAEAVGQRPLTSPAANGEAAHLALAAH